MRLVDGVAVKRHLHTQNVGGVKEALSMLLQAENRRTLLCMVGAHTLKNTHAVVQGVSKQVGLGLSPRDHLAVEPDPTVAVSHCLYHRAPL